MKSNSEGRRPFLLAEFRWLLTKIEIYELEERVRGGGIREVLIVTKDEEKGT